MKQSQEPRSEKPVGKEETLQDVAWRILRQGDTVLLLSLICLLDGKREIRWPKVS